MKQLACLMTALVMVLAAALAQAQADIGALGRIEPKDGVVHLMGPAGETVAQVMVKQGQVVRRGQPLASFASRPLLEVELALAELGLQEAQGVQGKSVGVHQNKVKVAKAELELAQKSFANLDKVGADAFSVMQVDQRKNQVATAQATLSSAVLELERTRQEADIRLRRAQRQVELSQEKLALATLRAPSDGTILEINKSAGEVCGASPFILLADLSVMYVNADIFEADLHSLSPGLEASITSKALGKTIKGRIETIGRLVSTKSKVAQVMIRLDEAAPADQLLNSEVNVTIKVSR